MPPKKNLIVSHQSVNGTPARVMAANELPEYFAALSSWRGKLAAAWHDNKIQTKPVKMNDHEGCRSPPRRQRATQSETGETQTKGNQRT